MSYVSSVDEFETLVDNANGVEYAKIPSILKKEIQEHVTEATANADAVTKDTVERAANETYEAMDDVAKKENFCVPSPATWKEFKEKEVSHIHETLNDLSYLVGKNAKEVKESIMDAVMEKTGSVVKAFRDATQVLNIKKEQIDVETKDMHKMLLNINHNVQALDAMLLDSKNDDIYKLLQSIKADSQEAISSFSQIYSHNQNLNRSFRPARAKEILISAKDTMQSYGEVLSTYVDMSRSYVENKAHEMVASVVGKVSEAAKKTSSFMSSLKNKLARGIEKGKEAFATVKNLRLAITPYDKRDADKADSLDGITNGLLTPISKNIVEEIAKSGFDSKMAQKAIEAATEQFKTSLTELAGKDKYQKMFKENAVAVAR